MQNRVWHAPTQIELAFVWRLNFWILLHQMGIDLATLTDYTANGLNYTHKTDCIDSKSFVCCFE